MITEFQRKQTNRQPFPKGTQESIRCDCCRTQFEGDIKTSVSIVGRPYLIWLCPSCGSPTAEYPTKPERPGGNSQLFIDIPVNGNNKSDA